MTGSRHGDQERSDNGINEMGEEVFHGDDLDWVVCVKAIST